jgi:hypothetical protein
MLEHGGGELVDPLLDGAADPAAVLAPGGSERPGVTRPPKLQTVAISAGSRPAAAAASSMRGRDSRYSGLSQSEAMGGIQPSASRPVTASDFGPTEPVRTRGAGASAGSRPDTW